MQTISRAGVGPWGLVIVAALGVAPAQGQESKLDVQVWAIRATQSNSEVSPELKPLVEQLKKQFKFTGYKVEKKAGGKGGINETVRADLIEAYQAEVVPVRVENGRVEVKITLFKDEKGKRKPILRTTACAERGKFMLAGGQPLSVGDTLIVAVAAR